MLSWVLRDYFTAFHWSNFVDNYRRGNWWWMIQFLVVTPVLMKVYDSSATTLTFLCVMVPIIFCVAAEGHHQTLLPKMIYLCPMSREERKKYILASCGVRIAIPTIVGIAGVLILLGCGIADWMYSVGVILNITVLSTCLGACLYVNGPSKFTENGTIDSNAGLLEIFILLVTMFTGFLYACWEGYASLWLRLVFLGVQLLIMVPMIVSYLKKWQKSMEQALLYENSGALYLYKVKRRTGR